MKKRNLNKVKLEEIKNKLKNTLIVLFIIFTIFYLIKGGLYSLLFDLRESFSVVIYSIILAVLLILLVILNAKDEPVGNEKKTLISSYITVGIIIGIILFSVVLIITLLDFFLPIIMLGIVFIVIYIISNYVLESYINKNNIDK